MMVLIPTNIRIEGNAGIIQLLQDPILTCVLEMLYTKTVVRVDSDPKVGIINEDLKKH